MNEVYKWTWHTVSKELRYHSPSLNWKGETRHFLFVCQLYTRFMCPLWWNLNILGTESSLFEHIQLKIDNLTGQFNHIHARVSSQFYRIQQTCGTVANSTSGQIDRFHGCLTMQIVNMQQLAQPIMPEQAGCIYAPMSSDNAIVLFSVHENNRLVLMPGLVKLRILCSFWSRICLLGALFCLFYEGPR